ncbi:MAG: SDR family oxidoreductase [Thermomicrobiales bacterium]
MALARARRAAAKVDFAGSAVVVVGVARVGVGAGANSSPKATRVTLLARESDALRRAAEELGTRGTAIAIPCDLREPGGVAGAVEAAATALGRLDVLVNNAGPIVVGPLEHMGEEEFAATLDIHFWGPLRAMRAAIPRMRQAGGGRIVNIASVGGLVAVPHLAPYSASKFALVGLSDAFRASGQRTDPRHHRQSRPDADGSPPNATFKGQHEQEYRWFAASAFPLLSVAADRAARQITDACTGTAIPRPDQYSRRRWPRSRTRSPQDDGRGDATRRAPATRPERGRWRRARSGWESQADLLLPLAHRPGRGICGRLQPAATERGGRAAGIHGSERRTTQIRRPRRRPKASATLPRPGGSVVRTRRCAATPNLKPSQAEGEQRTGEMDAHGQGK